MKQALQITTHNVPVSEALNQEIREKTAKLEQISKHIIACRVTVDAPHRHKHQGLEFNVRIDLSVPGSELVVNHRHHEEVYVAVRDAFSAMRKRLEAFEHRRRGQEKHHETLPHAVVSRLFPIDGYGFISSPEGAEIYFHENSVLNGAFDKMAVGAAVRYVEEAGEKGPQASTVTLLHNT